ncbi:Collagen alpha-1(XXII) chain [Varanus komodoensis]|nr:Collagen alpha-1(XXII) chain [Varanus komodoensis]
MLYVGLPLKTIRILQMVEDRAARMLSGTGRYSHITPVLYQLHWLPIEVWAQFKKEKNVDILLAKQEDMFLVGRYPKASILLFLLALWGAEKSQAQRAGCKNVHYDLVFILDASSSVGKEDFEKVRQWVANLVDTFEIGPDKTRVGVVRYSDRPTTEFDLGRYRTREEIKDAAKNIKYYGGNTNTGDALRYINTYSFSAAAGGRPSDGTIKKVAILLTDGRSQDHVLDPATAARQAGIRIFAVGVGEALKEELDEIASEPKSAHVFHVSDYNAIDKIRGKLRRRLCESEYENITWPPRDA